MQFQFTSENAQSISPCGIDHGFHTCEEQPERPAPSSLIPFHPGSLDGAARHILEKELFLLEPLARHIHGLVVVGSAAYGLRGPNSDIDLVIVTTAKGHGKVCEVVFEKEIEAALAGGKSPMEWTVLSPAEAENIFQNASPFAYSIRHGTVLRDDGYLALLRSRRHPRLPTREYARTCLLEKIITPYYAALRQFHVLREKRSSAGHCPVVTGEGASALEGLLARVVLHMLYITLPARGMMPLTKNDVVVYAQKAYGREAEKLVCRALILLRGNSPVLLMDECSRLKRFAVQLFKEVLRLVGVDHEVRTMLADGSKIAGKNFHSIQNSVLRNCVA